jgi:The GLUG motif
MERKRSFHHVVALGILVLALVRMASAQYGGGTGTPEDPYQIASSDDLIDLGDTPDDYDKHFLLTADIDLAGIPFDRAVIGHSVGRSRGSQSRPFTGVFAGNSHVIRHLHITGDDHAGLFGYVASGAVISSLGLENASIEGTADYAGGLVGHNDGSVLNCYTTGSITGNDSVGGLVGDNSGSISNCYSTSAVTGNDHVGGLVGYSSGSVSNCYSTGAAAGNDHVGGLAGANSGSVSSCYGTGAVTGDANIGGLVADNSGSVASSFWDTETSGLAASAGGLGLTTTEMQDMETYPDAGWDFVGESADGTGETWQMPETGGYPRLGVFEGHAPVQPQGQGTLAEPFLITNAFELGSVGHRPLAHYRLDTDIDLAGITWGIAVVPWFGGDFDGDGHVIRQLHIQGAGCLGLFGSLSAGSVVTDLGLEGASVQGTGSLIGALAGHSEAALINCYSTGTVTGQDDIGALVGINYGSISDCWSTGAVAGDASAGGLVGCNGGGSVSNCYSAATVTGHRWVGGAVGYNNHGSVSNCYNTGVITGHNRVGGLVGYNDYGSTVSNCYSIGAVAGDDDIGGLVGDNGGRVVHSFWDMDSSGVLHSSGGAGLATAEMMDPEWIGLQGWASDPNWLLDPYQDYPRLAWEGTEGQVVPEPVIDWMIGAGTSDVPYEINDVSQLLRISKASLLWEKDIALVNDLDLAEILWPQAVIPDFTGTFYGNDHVIRNLRITGNSYLGCFGRLEEDGAILNLGLLDVDIAARGRNVGGLVGYNDHSSVWNCHSTGVVAGDDHVGGLVGENNWGVVSNCYSTAVVAGDGYVGGLVGANAGRVRNCYSHGAVTGEKWAVGGLLGHSSGGFQVSDCYSTGAVAGKDDVGGLIGRNMNSRVSNCHSTGAVAGNDNVGGLLGYNQNSVSNCYSIGPVTGDTGVGGLVGQNQVNAGILNCYSTGATTGIDKVGGLVGRDFYGSIANCYSTGAVTGNHDVGGLVGDSMAGHDAERSFWDIGTSGQAASAGGMGRMTGEMQEVNTYLIAGWDFAEETNNGTDDIWRIDDGQDYPHLWWELDEED